MCDKNSPAPEKLHACAWFSCNNFTASHQRFKSGVFERTAVEVNGIYNATRSTLCQQHLDKLSDSVERVYQFFQSIEKDEKKYRKGMAQAEKIKVNVNTDLR
jgi:hypothetical protein